MARTKYYDEIAKEWKYADSNIAGSGSNSNYNTLSNKPSINNITLENNKTLKDLGIKQDYTADDIRFADGQTFQQKYDEGELKGEQGAAGANGEKGETGDSGVYVGKNEPTGSQNVWIDDDGTEDDLDYNKATNKPKINGVELVGSMTSESLNIKNQKLTFTGAASGSYDGSEPLTVEIPSGGGSPKLLGNFKSIYKIQYKGDTVGLSQIELTAEQYPDIKTCKEILVLCSGAKTKTKQVEMIVNDNLPSRIPFPRLYYANTNSTVGFYSQVTGEWKMDNQRDYATSQTKFMSAGVATSALVVSEIFKACEVNTITLNYFLGTTEENENLEVLVR